MSHHLDTPLAAQSGQLYIDDLYVFRGERGTVFVLDVNSNVNGMFTEPGFHPEARYEIKVHAGGADFETLAFRVSFDEPGADARQPLRLHVLTGDDAPAAMLSLVSATAVPSGLKPSVAAGERSDSFPYVRPL